MVPVRRDFCPTAPRVMASLSQNSDGSWTFTRQVTGQETFTFSASGLLESIADEEGNTLVAASESPGAGRVPPLRGVLHGMGEQRVGAKPDPGLRLEWPAELGDGERGRADQLLLLGPELRTLQPRGRSRSVLSDRARRVDHHLHLRQRQRYAEDAGRPAGHHFPVRGAGDQHL